MAFFLSYASRWLGSPLQMRARSSQTRRALHTSALSQHENVKVFTRHTFYKGKAALSFTPGRPIFKTNDEGAVILEKEGTMFLEFAPSTVPRQYDWTNKQVMALSVDEMGTILGLTMAEGCEFFHDPHMGSSNSGMVRKSLKVEPMPDKTGFFFSFAVVSKLENVDAHFTVPVQKGEFAVMRSSFNFMIPYLMGWHAVCNPMLVLQDVTMKGFNQESEWTR